MPYVEYDLGDFTDDELMDEIVERNLQYDIVGRYPAQNSEIFDLVQEIYFLRRLGKDYDHLVDKMIYDFLGKVL